MYQIIKTGGQTVAFTEELRFIKQTTSGGAYVEASADDAQGIAYDSTPYNLAGRNPLTGVTETVSVTKLAADEVEKAQAKAKRDAGIAECKAYLLSTDYIALKLAEALTDADTTEVSNLQTRYATELAERKAARDTINELEAEESAATE